MTGKSLVPILSVAGSGQIDPERTYVITGFERHVAAARDGNLPYPIRAITTSKYKYIRNMARKDGQLAEEVIISLILMEVRLKPGT